MGNPPSAIAAGYAVIDGSVVLVAEAALLAALLLLRRRDAARRPSHCRRRLTIHDLTQVVGYGHSTVPEREIDYLEAVLNANVYDVAVETPLQPAPLLSGRLGNRLFLKREDLQPVFSFKVRGAYNKMSRLSPAELRRGVVAASAGNHAQGVALAAQRLGTEATIVMPITTPEIKVESVAALGANVVLEGRLLRRRLQRGDADRAPAPAHLRPSLRRPRCDRRAGHDRDGDPAPAPRADRHDLRRGRRRRADRRHRGVREAAAARRSGSSGVEPEDANAMERSLRGGRRVTLPHVGLFADGVAVKQVGVETFRLARRYVDEMMLVDTDELCAAMKDVFEDTRAIVEPSAALGVAGAKRYVAETRDHRPQPRHGPLRREHELRPAPLRRRAGRPRRGARGRLRRDDPGATGQLQGVLPAARAAATSPSSTTASPTRPTPTSSSASASATTPRRTALLRKVERAGIRTLDLTDNELAKLHVRHLVGGPATAPNEVLYRFEFPDRPGALMQFLDAMSQDWNISLFHYRNHGADYGRVLAGIQVPPRERRAFKESLQEARLPARRGDGERRRAPVPRRVADPVSRPARAGRTPRTDTADGREELHVDSLDHPDHPAGAAAPRRLRLLAALARESIARSGGHRTVVPPDPRPGPGAFGRGL